ncbi:MAG: hypothetical protein K2X87_21015 [Gemmataceae bacterium]|nr:hypothetical protein [Gemmataceae bacterium]
MTESRAGRRVRGAAALVVAVLAVSAAVGAWLRADDKPAEKDKKDVGRQMVAAWALAGTPDKPEDPPEKGGRLKFFTGRHWAITDYNPDTGKVIFHHGGTYTIDGDDYAETIEYANKITAELIGKTFKFKIKVEKGTYTQVGNGNEFTERWKRAK